MRIRYTDRAEMFLNQVREQSVDEYHALNGLIIQLSTMPDIDNETKFIYSSSNSREVSVYRGEDWLIFYRVDNGFGEDMLIIISIWDANNPPHTRL